MELFAKILGDLKELTDCAGQKIKQIGLFWMGEPFLNKKLLDFIRLAKDSGVAEKILVTTNGSLISEKNVNEIVKSGLDTLLVSFYGTTDDEYLALNKKFTFRSIVDNLSTLKKTRDETFSGEGPLIVAKVFSNPELAERLLVDEYACVDSVAVESPFNWSDEYTKLTGQVVEIEDPGPMVFCPSAWFVMSINWRGLVGVCCADWANHINVGDFSIQSAKDIWAGDKLQEFKKSVASMEYVNNSACRGCTYFSVSHDPDTNIDELINNDLARACSKPKYQS